MTLDPLTLLLIDILIVLLVSLSYGIVWLENRKETALLWMLGSSLLVGAGMITRFLLPLMPALVISNSLIDMGVACIWMACRALRGARTMPLLLLGLPVLPWAVAAILPGFAQALSARIVLANCVLGCLFSLAAWEVWALEMDSRLLRLSIAMLLSIQAGINLVWALYNLILPASRSADILTMRGIVLFDLATIVFSLLMAIGLIVLIRERAMAHYRRIALLDAVTGVPNRRSFDEALLQAVGDARRRHRPVSLVMVDIDSFKSYNDRYGHIDGDRCLRAVAQALAAAAPRDAGAFRYGGEEFALVLPGMAVEEAVAATEELRLAVRRLEIAHGGREGGIVTISQGVASLRPGLNEPVGEAAQSLLRAADHALYRAKRDGRDRVVAAGTAAAEVVIGRIAS
ncbi:MAG TPA: GGDEF domain-containing protein [Acidisoma sp.]|uniref:GGDEF domain-containing protein n=1 Tax=Acidisoma sp. TaxID=1872115 RepID=UPI002C68B76A|nr:GGDEF domain-containing protein [Acidisoma sp.]HTI02246.1 GGDEF domain-containing protein [Acidisoma sp.]